MKKYLLVSRLDVGWRAAEVSFLGRLLDLRFIMIILQVILDRYSPIHKVLGVKLMNSGQNLVVLCKDVRD